MSTPEGLTRKGRTYWQHVRNAAPLLPPPGGEVVRECVDEIERLDAMLAAIHTACAAAKRKP